MLFTTWLQSLTRGPGRGSRTRRPGSSRGNRSRRRSFVPQLDVLEDRTVPSTLTVMNLNDGGAGSLRAAIGAAASGDTIQFAGGLHGTIPLASELSITDSLTINGPGAAKLTVSGSSTTRVFDVSGSSTQLTLSGLTIANGLESVLAGPAFGGGLLNNGASVCLSKVVFASNQAQAVGGYAGGGAVANLGGTLTADQTDFLSNSASGAATNFGNGGAVYDDQVSIVDIEHSTFCGNLATGGQANGGAIGHYGGSQLTLDHCSFAGNQALALPPGSDAFGLNAAGGAIESDESGSGYFEGAGLASAGGSDLGQPTMTITHCSFTGNQAAQAVPSAPGADGAPTEGGAMDVDAGAKATVSDSLFACNSAVGGDGGAGSAGMDGGAGGRTLGGAILVYSGNLTVSNSLFLGNVSHGGNGGAGGSGNGGNGAQGDGGAILNLFGGPGLGLTITDCSIVTNTAQGGAGGAPGSGGVGGSGGVCRGGGLANERGATATVSNTSIVNNQALGGAGAAGSNGGNALGGGVYTGRFTNQVANLELLHCTVSANLVQGGAGGVGGNGGDALGGGICNANTNNPAGQLITSDPYPILDLDGTSVLLNRAVGGAAGSGGVAGSGIGGGLYNQDLATAEVDSHSLIKFNTASTSNDNVFGATTPI